MRRFALSCLFAALLTGTSPLDAQQTIDGYWAGRGQLGDEVSEFSVTFRTDATGTKGFIDIPDTGTAARELTDIFVDGKSLKFVMPRARQILAFQATVEGEVMKGTLQFGPLSAPFTLTRRLPQPPPYREEQVQYRNGTIVFAASLLLPKTPGPHPALVFQIGARPNTRDAWRFEADYFARRGIACLIYDNRSVGGSTGDYRVGFNDLASDSIAAVHYLRGRKDINRDQIGLYAASQGGWIAPLVATQSPELAFLILVAAPAVTVARNIQYESETRLRADGVPEPEIAEALEFKHSVMQLIASGAPDDKIDALAATMKPSWSEVGIPTRTQWQRKWFPLVLSYDPAPVWEHVHIPVLVNFGELDQNVRVAETVPILEGALTKAGNKDFTIKVWPGADHSILVTSKIGRPHLADGYMDSVTEWLLKRVTVIAPAQPRAK